MGNTPDSTSSDYNSMAGYWQNVDDIMAGAAAVRAAGKRYLPQFPNETNKDYEFRRNNAKFTNVFRDIVENLAARPFEDEIHLEENAASERINQFVEDVDGRGNSLHNFSKSWFLNGVAKAINWVLIDYTKDIPPNATIAEEKSKGARPFWVSIDPNDLLAVYSDIDNGKEVFTHVRKREDVLERVDFAEVTKKRIRIYNREKQDDGSYAQATWELWEKKEKTTNKRDEQWERIDAGNISIGIIPLVPFFAGRRIGSSWRIVPPLQDALDLQIELYQQETALKSIKESAAFPMLSANGVTPPKDKNGKVEAIEVGCKTVLYAPPSQSGQSGQWAFIEPSAQSLKFLADDVLATIAQLRELGRQPLTAQTGNLTVVTTAFAAEKGNAAISAWALNIKDALENALKITALWFKEEIEPEVCIKSDFDIGIGEDKAPEYLLTMRANGDLSLDTLWSEFKRRSILSPDFKDEEELQKLLGGDTGDDNEGAIMPDNSPNADADGAQGVDAPNTGKVNETQT